LASSEQLGVSHARRIASIIISKTDNRGSSPSGKHCSHYHVYHRTQRDLCNVLRKDNNASRYEPEISVFLLSTVRTYGSAELVNGFSTNLAIFPATIVGHLTTFLMSIIFGCNRKIYFPQSAYTANA
jgi:hypothetical protein